MPSEFERLILGAKAILAPRDAGKFLFASTSACSPNLKRFFFASEQDLVLLKFGLLPNPLFGCLCLPEPLEPADKAGVTNPTAQ